MEVTRGPGSGNMRERPTPSRRARLHRATESILPLGWGVIIGGLLAGVGGTLLGWDELRLVFVGALVLTLLSIPWIIGRFPIEVTREVDPPRVTVGDTAIAMLTAHNPTSKPTSPKLAEDRLGDRVVPVPLPILAPGKSFQVPYALPTDARGAFDLGPVTLVRADPVGLFRREREHGSVDTFWVHPRTVALATMPTGLARDLEGPTSDKSPAGGIAFHTLREYEVGDDYRHIHWRSTAKTGSLMVRHYVDNRRPHLTVVLDDRRSSYTSNDEFDRAVETAASIALAGLRSGYPVSVHSNDHEYGLASGRANTDDLLDRFAEVTLSADESLTETMSMAARANVGTTIFALVTGSVALDSLLELMVHTRTAQRVLVVRHHNDAPNEHDALPGATLVDARTVRDLEQVWSGIVRS